MPATVAERLGAAAPIAYLVCATLMTLIALCFAAAGSRVSLTGGLYAYIDTAFGGFAGFLGGYLYSVTACLSVASVATAFAGTAGVLSPVFSGGLGRRRAAGGAVCRAGGRERERHQAGDPSGRSYYRCEADTAAAPRRRGRLVAERRLPAHDDADGVAGGAGVDRAVVRVCRRGSGAHAVGRNSRSGSHGAARRFSARWPSRRRYTWPCRPSRRARSARSCRFTKMRRWSRRRAGCSAAARELMFLVGMAVSIFGYIAGDMLGTPRALFALARDGVLPRRSFGCTRDIARRRWRLCCTQRSWRRSRSRARSSAWW